MEIVRIIFYIVGGFISLCGLAGVFLDFYTILFLEDFARNPDNLSDLSNFERELLLIFGRDT